MAAAAAIAGHLIDVRGCSPFADGRSAEIDNDMRTENAPELHLVT